MNTEVIPPLFQREPWQVHASCRGLDPRLFFPKHGETAAPAKQVCAGCPVRAECLDFAMRGPERFGIFGGLSEKQRRRLRLGLRVVDRPPGRPAQPIAHGTNGGYNAHYRRHEAPCPACIDAHSRYQQTTRSSRAGGG